MARQLFTAAVIRRLVREQKAAGLVMRPDDLVTPEAADVARELGVLIAVSYTHLDVYKRQTQGSINFRLI